VKKRTAAVAATRKPWIGAAVSFGIRLILVIMDASYRTRCPRGKAISDQISAVSGRS
jgi:hypothetical protein